MGCANGIVANGNMIQTTDLMKTTHQIKNDEAENDERGSNVEVYLDSYEEKNQKKKVLNVRKVKISKEEFGTIILKMNQDIKEQANGGKTNKDCLQEQGQEISETHKDLEQNCQLFQSFHSELLLKLTNSTFYPTQNDRNLLKNYAASVRKLATANKQAEIYSLAILQFSFYLLILSKIENKIDVQHQTKIEREIGWMHYRTGNYNEAATLYEKCLKSIKRNGGKDSEDYEVTLQALADVNYQRGHLTASLENLHNCLEIEEKRTGKGVIYAELIHKTGKVYNRQGTYQKALKEYGRALDIKERILGDRQNIGCLQILGSIGNTHYNMGSYTQSIKYHTDCLKICEKQAPKHENYAYLNLCLGNSHLKLLNYSEALQFFQIAERNCRLTSKQYLSLLNSMALCSKQLNQNDKFEESTTKILMEALTCL